MNLARAARPASLALAAGASALFIAGFIAAGVVVGGVAVIAAWFRPAPPPAD